MLRWDTLSRRLYPCLPRFYKYFAMRHLHSDARVLRHCHHVLLISQVEHSHRIVPELKHVRTLALQSTKVDTSKVQWRHVVVFHSTSKE